MGCRGEFPRAGAEVGVGFTEAVSDGWYQKTGLRMQTGNRRFWDRCKLVRGTQNDDAWKLIILELAYTIRLALWE